MTRTRHQVGYGRGTYRLEDDFALFDEGEIKKLLVGVFRSPDYQPPTLPKVGMELMNLMKRPDVGLPEVRHLLESDAVIAARVLQVASSAFYATRAPIQSLQDAVVRLGIETMTDIFFKVSLNMRVFRSTPYQEAMDDLRRHSAATAILARRICRYTSVGDEYAFLCGLLHDVGLAASLIALTEGLSSPPPFENVRSAVHGVHEGAAQRLAQLWKLPPDVGVVISNHHNFVIDGRIHPVCAAVLLADHLASETGFTSGFHSASESEGQEASDALEISKTALETIMKESERELATVS